jgi:ribosomal protein S18 acetylase RimI-like enzyme
METSVADRIAERADASFVAHVTWPLERTAGMTSRVSEGLVIADSGLACDTFNFVCRARLDPGDLRDAATGAIAHFGDRPFSWWVGPADRPRHLAEVLLDQGLERADTELAMALPLAILPREIAAVPGLQVRRVDSMADLEAFARLSAANWTPPDRHVLTFYHRVAPALLDPSCPLWLYLGLLDGEAVATAEAAVAQGTAGLYNISTRPAARGRGIGSRMTWQPLRDAAARGCDLGVLQAAPEGVSLYRRLGFSAFGDITEFKPRGPGPATEAG